MTIITTQSRIGYAGDNVTTLFPIPFEFFLQSDITAVKTAVGGVTSTLVLGVDYTLANAGVPGGGSLTKTTALLTGESLAIFLNPPITQASHYISNAPFPAGTLENDIDRQAQISQRLQDQISRSLRASDADLVAWPQLPAAIVRANMLLGFDNNGVPTTTVPTTTTSISITTGQATIGPPLSGSALNLVGASGLAALTAASTIQVIGPNSLTNINQNVNQTQLLFHGYAAEMVSINGAAGADLKVWSFFADNAGAYHWRIENDALNATADFMRVTRTGAFSGSQAAITFPIGYGSIAFNPTATNAYQCVINAGAVAGFANGLKIQAGSIAGDAALTIVGQSGAAFGNISGQNQWTISPVTLTGLTGLTVTGIASNASPVATFGGTASNYITVTDGAGMTAVAQAATGNAVQLGASSNHGLNLIANNAAQLTISNAGAIAFKNVATTTSAPGAGGAGALPATPAGYATFTVGTTARQIPYY